jgi:hypothetical protein
MGQECNISVIYDRFFYTGIPVFAFFARLNNIPHIFRSKNEKTFSDISKSALVAPHPIWPKVVENDRKKRPDQEKTPPELLMRRSSRRNAE